MPNTRTDDSGSTKRPGRQTARTRSLSLLILKVRRLLFSFPWFYSCCRSIQDLVPQRWEAVWSTQTWTLKTSLWCTNTYREARNTSPLTEKGQKPNTNGEGGQQRYRCLLKPSQKLFMSRKSFLKSWHVKERKQSGFSCHSEFDLVETSKPIHWQIITRSQSAWNQYSGSRDSKWPENKQLRQYAVYSLPASFNPFPHWKWCKISHINTKMLASDWLY